jgi:hypothetical protein
LEINLGVQQLAYAVVVLVGNGASEGAGQQDSRCHGPHDRAW